jgi:guanine deaminase
MEPDRFMSRAIALAEKGVRQGDGGPFGAVVVREGEVIGEGWNRVVGLCDPTAHAEILAIRKAAGHIGSYHLDGCVLYASCEPCPMCLAAAYWAHIDRIYYAASAPDAAAIGFDDAVIYEQLCLPAGSRSLPAHQLMRDEALGVFSLWQQSEARKPY